MASIDSMLLVDWPNPEVPQSLARTGLRVVAQEGPDTYVAYEANFDEVRRLAVEAPASVDVVYAYRPLDELPEIVEFAVRLGARAVWWETGPEPPSAEEFSSARVIVEGAGLEFRAGRPQASAA